MIAAAIDLGSNTVRVVVARKLSPGPWQILFQAQEITGLGKEVGRSGRIGPGAAERTLMVLSSYQEILSRFRLDELIVAGTEALRKATNAPEFLKRVEDTLGWRIRVLTGEEEARYAFLGIRYGPDSLPEQIMALDIGGSSTELSVGKGRKLESWISLPVGAAVLGQEFLSSDPPPSRELEGMFSFLQEILGPPLSAFRGHGSHLLVGTGGTITSLAAIHLGLADYDPSLVSQVSLSRRRIRGVFNRLCRLPLRQRMRVRGLEPGRADIIVPGIAILLSIMEILPRQAIRVSDGGLREGLLDSILGEGD